MRQVRRTRSAPSGTTRDHQATAADKSGPLGGRSPRGERKGISFAQRRGMLMDYKDLDTLMTGVGGEVHVVEWSEVRSLSERGRA